MIGSVATCPKCGSQFTVAPQEDPVAAPPTAIETKAEAIVETKPPSPIEAKEKAAAIDETKPAPIAVDSTEPASPNAEARPAVPATLPGADAPPSDGPDTALAGSLIALTLFGLGILATVFPYGRFIGLGLCGLSLLIALGCLLAEGLPRKLGAAAGMLSLVAVLVLTLAPTWVGLDALEGIPSTTPQGPYSINLSSTEIGGGDFVDASKSMYANGDVRVGIRGTSIAPVELAGPNGVVRWTRENVLKIQIRIANGGVARRIPLADWARGNAGGVKLADSAGRPLKPKVFPPNWQPAGTPPSEGIYPGKSADVLLFFEPPAGSGKKGKRRSDTLQLEMPGSGLGQVEPIRFKIPIQI